MSYITWKWAERHRRTSWRVCTEKEEIYPKITSKKERKKEISNLFIFRGDLSFSCNCKYVIVRNILLSLFTVANLMAFLKKKKKKLVNFVAVVRWLSCNLIFGLYDIFPQVSEGYMCFCGRKRRIWKVHVNTVVVVFLKEFPLLLFVLL